MTTVLAIDAGTTATKAVVIGGSGKVLATESVRIKTRALPGGGMEQDPDEIWRSILTAAAPAIAQAGRGIDAVALATQGESVLAWDPRSGEALSAVVTWQDRRASGICGRLAEHGEHLAAATGLRLDPYFTAPKLAWLRENTTRAGVVTTIDAWLTYRLTGRTVTDAATASRSLLVDLVSGTWNPELLAVFGLEGEEMPQIAANDEVIGETTVFGFPAPLAAVILDQPAALLAQRCLKPGQAKATYGTGAFFLANIGSIPAAGRGALSCSTGWQVGEHRIFALDGQVYAAASALTMLARIGAIARVEEIDVACKTAGPGSTVFVPGFDTARGGVFEGFGLDASRAQLTAAAVYGIAAAVADLHDEADLDDGALRVDGGLTNVKTLLQAQADLLQIEIAPYRTAHATAQGAAALARLALDRAASLEAEVPDFASGPPVLPRWSLDQAADYRERWRHAAKTTPG
ncbi:MAG TPA: FGGY family carbohydrate kinase [Actinospica sp.]|jgi:glycerol kinase|nr:FGGY family carbohydrate kinase [Actinospica sp.]